MKSLSPFDVSVCQALVVVATLFCFNSSGFAQETAPGGVPQTPAASSPASPTQPSELPTASSPAPTTPTPTAVSVPPSSSLPPASVQAVTAPVAPAPSPIPVPTGTVLGAPTLPPPQYPIRNRIAETDPTEYQNVRVQLSGVNETQSIADPFNLQAKITNRTGDEITISQVRWELPRSIVATRPQETTREAGRIPWHQGTAVAQPNVLPHGSEQLVDLTMPDIHENWWSLPRNVRLLSFKPGEYPVKVRVEYTAGPYRRISVAEETIRVRFDATPWFYVWGGIIGSMVGVLFEFFYTTARGLDRFEWPRDVHGRIAPGYAIRDLIAFLFRWLLGGTAKWLTGSLTAAIVLLFLYYYKDVQLPITVRINDFFGAVVVGLVAHRLGLWVYETLFSRGEKPRGGSGGGGSSVDQFHFPQQVIPALTYTERR